MVNSRCEVGAGRGVRDRPEKSGREQVANATIERVELAFVSHVA